MESHTRIKDMILPTLTPEKLRWIVCPVCHQSLQLVPSGLRCTGCNRNYLIVDGLPILIHDRSQIH
jgi:uncharacterized protein YbaR (Trm112 family)